jgi:pSer/pThr/pTyr-binding forkhead associated (FHA) protein
MRILERLTRRRSKKHGAVNTNVTLTLEQGDYCGKELAWNGARQCTVGRGEDCSFRVPPGLLYQEVSRHHCQLEIDLPDIRVRDLGSRNGTFVNGRLIGRRLNPDDRDKTPGAVFPQHELADGDALGLGPLTFRVRIDRPGPRRVGAM